MGIFSWLKKQFSPPKYEVKNESVSRDPKSGWEYPSPPATVEPNDRLPDVIYAGLHESTKDKEAIEVGAPKFVDDAIAVEPPIEFDSPASDVERERPILDPVAAGAVEKPKKPKKKAKKAKSKAKPKPRKKIEDLW